ncbi:hypothetical protein FQN52_002233 [Onygenales sp. PD_12]|nr:hypothetical protein FQN52_002233 [Onygenales sp. PD_12]
MTLFTIACGGTVVFRCVPVDAYWTPEKMKTARCFSNKTYTNIGLFHASINIFTDVLFATVPIFIFKKLQINRRDKVVLIGIFSLGYVACMAGIAKAHYQSIFIDPKKGLQHIHLLFIFMMLELNIGILAASLPTLKPLVRKFLGTARGSHPTRYTGNGGLNAKFRRKSRRVPDSHHRDGHSLHDSTLMSMDVLRPDDGDNRPIPNGKHGRKRRRLSRKYDVRITAGAAATRKIGSRFPSSSESVGMDGSRRRSGSEEYLTVPEPAILKDTEPAPLPTSIMRTLEVEVEVHSEPETEFSDGQSRRGKIGYAV